MAEKQPFNMKNRLRVCIDKFETDFSGRVYMVLEKEEILFCDISDFLVKLDKLFDRIGFPQSFQDKRSFHWEEPDNFYCYLQRYRKEPEEVLRQRGKLKTFDIIVRSRKNTTWQGEVLAVDGGCLGEFKEAIKAVEIMERHIE